MDKKIEEVIKLRERFYEIYYKIINGEVRNAFAMMQGDMENINTVFMEFINDCSKFKEYGVDISIDVLINQLKNLLEAFEYRDSILLTDTLKYEMIDSLDVYLEILNTLKDENIEI